MQENETLPKQTDSPKNGSFNSEPNLNLFNNNSNEGAQHTRQSKDFEGLIDSDGEINKIVVENILFLKPKEWKNHFNNPENAIHFPYYCYLYEKLLEAVQKMTALKEEEKDQSVISSVKEENTLQKNITSSDNFDEHLKVVKQIRTNFKNNISRQYELQETIDRIYINMIGYIHMVNNYRKAPDDPSLDKDRFNFKSFDGEQVEYFFLEEDQIKGMANDPFLHKKLNIKQAVIYASSLDALNWAHLIIKTHQIISYKKPVSLNKEGAPDNKRSEIQLVMTKFLNILRYNKREAFIFFCNKFNLKDSDDQGEFNNMKLSYEENPHMEHYNKSKYFIELANEYIQLISANQSTENVTEGKLQEDKKVTGTKETSEISEAYKHLVDWAKKNFPEITIVTEEIKNKDWEKQSLEALYEDCELEKIRIDIIRDQLNSYDDSILSQKDIALFVQKKKELVENFEFAKKQIMAQHTIYTKEHKNWFQKKLDEIIACCHCGGRESRLSNYHSQHSTISEFPPKDHYIPQLDKKDQDNQKPLIGKEEK